MTDKYNRFTIPPRVIFEDAPDLANGDPEPANRISVTEALRRYTENVRTFLASHNEEPRLTDAEHELVRHGFQTAMRYQLAASLIRTDRHLQGAGRK